MLPVNGARSELDCKGSSRSLMLAVEWNISTEDFNGLSRHTIVRVNKILLDLSVVIVVVRVACRGTRHHGHSELYFGVVRMKN